MAASNVVSASGLYRFKDITTIPQAKDLVDIVLSQTQRRTPTQVHPQFKISRIRSFYMRKVKYCQQTFHDKFTSILTEFPRLDDIHPFYADLCNVLYDRDHYKLALGQINAVRGVVDHVAKDYVRLLKYADSPYKCKMLKRAALGRMCTTVRKLGDSLKYLEEVRQHLSRLPSINPNTRTLILTGYPNVGKSSFINSVTHANVEVQPYAFTTKSLFVGHFDYDYVRWQVIDTPGILDHPLANRNTIELTAITALAHIQAAVMFFIDISEQCGFSIENQVGLFHSIKVLFRNKPLVIVLNKTDVTKFRDLAPERQELIQNMSEGLENVAMLETSCLRAEGIDQAKNKGCDLLLRHRAETQLQSHKGEAALDSLHVTSVQPPSSRPPQIPPSVLAARMKAAGKENELPRDPSSMVDDDQSAVRLLRDVGEENGGAGVFSVDLNTEWKLKVDDWKYDVIPEVFEGKNIADFIDPDIEEKLKELEREEDLLLQQSAATEVNDTEWNDTFKTLTQLHKKIELNRIKSRLRRNHAHKVMPSVAVPSASVAEATQKLSSIGYKVADGLTVKPKVSKQRQTSKTAEFSDLESASASSCMSDIDGDEAMSDVPANASLIANVEQPSSVTSIKKRLVTLSRARTKCIGASPFANVVQRTKQSIPNRITRALPDEGLRKVADKIRRKREEGMKKMRKAGEADRFIGTKMPRHLFSGKRGIGKSDRR